MKTATKDFLNSLDLFCEKRREEIRNSPDSNDETGRVFYVRSDGCDENDGLSDESAWRTLAKVSSYGLSPGDTVKFRRGDIFRGFVRTCPQVKYCAYGEGEKPKLYGWEKDLCDPSLWTLAYPEFKIWLLRDCIPDCGTLVFNGGKEHSRKLIPSFRGGRFVCRDDEEKPFYIAEQMTRDLDLFCAWNEKMTERPSKGEDFPVPELGWDSLGRLFLRCDRGNPGEVFDSIEALPRRHMFTVGSNEGVTIDNLCLKYIGTHAISAGGYVKDLNVTNCEIGWVGGAIQHYLGTDPNYPQGRRGSVTRYGNGVEIYGGCDGYIVKNCYIYQVYDAGITHQITTGGKKYEQKNIRYSSNLIENCVYSIEYFLDKNKGEDGSVIDGCVIEDNVMRFSGFGWGQQRHNVSTPAHVKGWSYMNTARNFSIRGNVFDRAACRMVHIVAEKAESMPEMSENTYIQTQGASLGSFGANGISEPPIMAFDEEAEESVRNVLGDESARVFVVAP